MEHGRSNAPPLLDEEDTESDTPLPSHLVVRDDTAGQLQRITGTSSLGDWADENVGDTHIGKRKTLSVTKKQKGKKKVKSVQERPVGSDEDTTDGEGRRIPTYQESNDSSSPSTSPSAGGQGAPSHAPTAGLHFTGARIIFMCSISCHITSY